MIGTTAQLRTLTAAELRTEARLGHTLWTGVPYAVSALLVIALAVGADIPLLRRIGIGTYWAVVLLFGSLICARQRATDRPARRELLLLLGVDPAVRFLARAIASSVVVFGFTLLLAPVAVVLYDLSIGRAAATAAAALLLAVGLGTLGTLAADLTTAPGVPPVLVPLVVTPLAVPLVLAGVQAGQPTTTPTGVVAWLLLSFTAVLVFVVAGLLAARTLQENHA